MRAKLRKDNPSNLRQANNGLKCVKLVQGRKTLNTRNNFFTNIYIFQARLKKYYEKNFWKYTCQKRVNTILKILIFR